MKAEIVDRIMNRLRNGEEIIIRDDPRISMVNGGNTRIWLYDDVEPHRFKEYSSGCNWSDQESTVLSEKRVREILLETPIGCIN